MAIAFIFEVDGIGAAEYDGLMDQMGLDSAAAFPAGCIAHLAGPQGENGWRVVDVWESADAANAFYGSDQFAPVRNDAVLSGMQPNVWSLHRVEVP